MSQKRVNTTKQGVNASLVAQYVKTTFVYRAKSHRVHDFRKILFNEQGVGRRRKNDTAAAQSGRS